MRHILRNAIFAVGLAVLALWAVTPPQEKLRLGKDLRGGTTLVYSVQIDPGQDARETIGKTIEILKERVDPSGLLEIQMIAQGQDRIEVTMPLPNDEVKALRAQFDEALVALDRETVDPDQWERAMRLGGDERRALMESLSGGREDLLDRMREAASLYDEATAARAALRAAEADEAGEDVLDLFAADAADAELEYEAARDDVLAAGLSAEDMRRVLNLSNAPRVLQNAEGEYQQFPSPRARELERIEREYAAQWPQVQRVLEAHRTYITQRTSLDDPEELKRLISAAGVPSFRITIDPQGSGSDNTHPDEQRLREELQEKGPLNVRARDARWCKVNKAEAVGNIDSIEALEFLERDPTAFWRSRGLVGERYQGEHWVLCWDTRANRLTQGDGDWSVARSFQTQDQVGRPAVGFQMDERGALRLGQLTGGNVGNKMAVLLDEQVYTAPVLNAAISRSGIIEGDFSSEELNYIIRVLTAGSLQAALSPEPLSQNTIAPEFGADNLIAGRNAGLIALAAVSVFMVFYYFAFGVVAVTSLLFNALLILGAMSLARAAFTLPGIAGVILTFGMAVDANVLIYERIREEQRKGADLRTATRLGFSKALSSIVDGNVTNLIVCFVLANLGTQEIKGFAITLGIGVVGTMISSLFVSRLILALLVDVLKVKSLSMLPTVVPVLERTLEPSIDWMKARYVFVVVSLVGVGLGVGMIAYQGEKMLDTEFRGGTQVTLELGEDDSGQQIVLTRADVQNRVYALADGLAETDPLRPLRASEVVPVNPQADGVTSARFQIKTYATDQGAVIDAIVTEFSEELDTRPPLSFDGRAAMGVSEAPLGPILSGRLGEALGRPEFRNDVTEYIGGVAILLEDLSPRPTMDSLRERLAQTRGSESFSGTLNRTNDVILLAGTPDAVEAAAIVVADGGLSYFDNRELWEDEVASTEWTLTMTALTDTTTLASVQSFSPVIAETFQQTAIVAVVLSLLLILIYIWVRFGSVRYSAAAIACLLHDIMIMIGLIALAEILYDHDITAGLAQSVGVQPFKIDLNLVAAILTIIGYSLNDTIIIMDRIRENRGKLPYASREVINQSINQTISRTVITSGTTFLATLILYVFGGEGVRAFSYALLAGVVVGTYSSIAVAAPLVWSRKASGPSDYAPTRLGAGDGGDGGPAGGGRLP